MQIVYLVWHTNPLNDDQKLIGIYSTEKNARNAIERVKDKPGFKDSPEGLEVFSHQLDRDGWIEGFVSSLETKKE